MLMRFGAANHLSIYDYQELSLVASSLKDTGADLIQIDGVREKLLPGALVYGANAAGKTNLLLALRRLAKAVRDSYGAVSPTENIRRTPFLLKDGARNEPTTYDCDFVLDNTRYHYGFSATDKEYVAEWLYYFPGGNRNLLFRREISQKTPAFGKTLKGRNKAIFDLTRPNSLFLSAAAQSGHPFLSSVANYFQEMIMFDVTPIMAVISSINELDPRVISFLREADTGIMEYKIETQERSKEVETFMEEFRSLISTNIPNIPPDFPSDQLKRISFGHVSSSNSPVFLNLDWESRGTLRLLDILVPAFKALETGAALVVDELDTSLHTLLAQRLVALFSSKTTNPRGAQIIASTHDTNLLRSPSLRRDQIWFAEKSPSGATEVYPLSDLKTRNTDDFEKGYLQGRFGAVPFVGDVRALWGGAN